MGRRDLTLPERLRVEALLEDAFAPLRSRRAGLSPLRVHAAVRWGRGAPPAVLGWSRAVSRVSELSLAVAMSVMVFVAAFGTSPARVRVPTPVDPAVYVPNVNMPLRGDDYLRWLQLGQMSLDRYVPVHDWLDPGVVHLGAMRRGPSLDPPAPTRTHEPY